MNKKSDGLLYKFGTIFATFTVAVLILSAITTYFLQVSIYKAECATNVQNLCEYLKVLIRQDGMDFVHYQEYYLKNADKINVPFDYDGNYIPAMEAYETLMEEQYPGMVIDKDIAFDDLSDEVKQAFAVYTHEYWLHVFESAVETFGVKYAYYMTPGDDPFHMHYIIDAVRDKKVVDGQEYISLGLYDEASLKNHHAMWEAWETGKTPQGYDYVDNEFGKTYAYYSPLIIDGKKLGVIAVDLEEASVNKQIIKNTVLQLLGTAIFLVLCVVILLWYVDKNYISKIKHLVSSVRLYTEKKDVGIAQIIKEDATTGDEISLLAHQTADMILNLDSYIKNLVKTKEELTEIRIHANELRAQSSRDPLTGIRNKNAYEEEIRRIEWDFARGENVFGFARIDQNDLFEINEKYGHDKGDISVRNLCSIICAMFDHYPVFRLDGDEFVVVLRNCDQYDAQLMVQRFKDEIERYYTNGSLNPWERISAAIGAAVYDSSKDASVDDVFTRAKIEMYKDKEAMKAARD
jgi:diguanylate cyclase (GGDEF)-like protein